MLRPIILLQEHRTSAMTDELPCILCMNQLVFHHCFIHGVISEAFIQHLLRALLQFAKIHPEIAFGRILCKHRKDPRPDALPGIFGKLQLMRDEISVGKADPADLRQRIRVLPDPCFRRLSPAFVDLCDAVAADAECSEKCSKLSIGFRFMKALQKRCKPGACHTSYFQQLLRCIADHLQRFKPEAVHDCTCRRLPDSMKP